MNKEEIIEVPKAWFESLANIADRVQAQMDELKEDDYIAMAKTDISMLIGYASSAKIIVKRPSRIN